MRKLIRQRKRLLLGIADLGTLLELTEFHGSTNVSAKLGDVNEGLSVVEPHEDHWGRLSIAFTIVVEVRNKYECMLYAEMHSHSEVESELFSLLLLSF